MKISEWIADLQGELEYYGDVEIDSLPRGWEDFLPDDVALWLMRNGQIEYVMMPDGSISAGVMGCDLPEEEDEIYSDHIRSLVRHCIRCADVPAGDDMRQLHHVMSQCVRMIDRAMIARSIRPAGFGRFERKWRSTVPPSHQLATDGESE